MKAERIHYHKEQQSNGNIVEMVIWKIPPTSERPHGLKYRLHYGSPDGVCLLRHDNKTGKGDHRHIGEREETYHFETVEKLIADFLKDIKAYERGQLT